MNLKQILHFIKNLSIPFLSFNSLLNTFLITTNIVEREREREIAIYIMLLLLIVDIFK